MKRIVVRTLVGVLVLALLGYISDWAVWRVRVSRGTGYGAVEVKQFLASRLKGGKVEYDFMGIVPVTCSRSAFPQQGNPACWWVERHKSQWM